MIFAERVRAARARTRLTQQQASYLVYTTDRAWRRWEQDEESKSDTPIPAAMYRLFLIRTEQDGEYGLRDNGMVI
jgi:hypothetical protein